MMNLLDGLNGNYYCSQIRWVESYNNLVSVIFSMTLTILYGISMIKFLIKFFYVNKAQNERG